MSDIDLSICYILLSKIP